MQNTNPEKAKVPWLLQNWCFKRQALLNPMKQTHASPHKSDVGMPRLHKCRTGEPWHCAGLLNAIWAPVATGDGLHTPRQSQAGGSRWKLGILPSVLLTPVAVCHLVRTERAVPGHKGRGGISRPHPGLIGECNWHPTQNLLLLYHTKCPKQNGKQGYGEVTELHSLNSTATQGHVCSNKRWPWGCSH